MSIEFYPDSLAKKKVHVVEKLQEPDVLYSVADSVDITASGLDVTIWSPRSWEVHRVALHFDAATAKDFDVSVQRGRGVVADKNDRLYFKMNGVNQQPIYLSEGYYDGTALATELQTQLDANAAFSGVSATPFTVNYTSGTGLFEIQPASGQIAYFDVNGTVSVRRNSSAGHLIGFTQDQALAGTLTSDTAVPGLGTDTVYISDTASSSTDVLGTDVLAMTVDNALTIGTSAVATTVHYEVVYKVLDV